MLQKCRAGQGCDSMMPRDQSSVRVPAHALLRKTGFECLWRRTIGLRARGSPGDAMQQFDFTGGDAENPQYLYVKFTWSTQSISIERSGSYPESDLQNYCHVLVSGYLDSVPGYGTHNVVTQIHHEGDIHIATAFA